MAGNQRELESGLTRFLTALYACFRFVSKLLICFTWCSCDRKPKAATHKCKYNKNNGTKIEEIPAEERTVSEKKFFIPYSFPKRYILVIMTFMGFVNMFALRVNLNVALESMVNNHTIHQNEMTVLRVSQ